MTVNIANHDCTIIWNGVYYFALSDYPNISRWELKKLLAFMHYEKMHGRQTEIVCDEADIMLAVNDAITHPETVADAVIPEKITECTACKHKGCLTEFVCHTASAENAKQIFRSGKLLSAVHAFGKSADALVLDSRNAAGDPADYFDHIMFGWGNHPGYVFDGYHPVKIRDELMLADWLYACVVPEEYRDVLAGAIPANIADRVHYLQRDKLGIWDWAEKVYAFVERQNKSQKFF